MHYPYNSSPTLENLVQDVKMTNETIQIIIAIGTCVAAFAACFAACVSLWIATRKKKHKINIKVYSGFNIKKDGSYIRCRKNSETLKKFSDSEPMLEIIVENRGEIPFFTQALEIQFKINIQLIVVLNTIERVNQEDVQFVRRIKPGESTTYLYRFCSLIATKELFELFLSEISNGKKPKVVIRTGFEEEAFALMPKEFCQYILEYTIPEQI